MNVLVVEDEKSVRLLIKKTLIESDLSIGEIFEAGNGKEGIEVMNKHTIDLLLVDIYMPVMDGLEMIDYVMSRPDLKETPAIVVSTENDEKRIDAIIRKGLGFVHKPFTKKLLKSEIKKLRGFS